MQLETRLRGNGADLAGHPEREEKEITARRAVLGEAGLSDLQG
ncbi:hypothetical protein [Hyphomicrobium sp.]